jgi:hypothetical protein
MSMRYPGGLIASSPVNAAYPSGVWTQAQTQPYAAQNVWMRDQYWPYTSLLLQGNGTNGAQNNTFLDSSTNNFTITRNGNTTQGSFTPYEANGYWSNYFDGSSILTFASSTNYAPGAGEFCLECWFMPTSTSGDRWLIGNRNGNYVPFAINYPANSYPGTLLFYISSNGSSWDIVNGTTVSGVSANQWNHFALVRNSSNQFIVYINGVGTTIATNAANFSSAQPFYVGGSPSGSDADFIGYISNARFVKGSSVYSGNFTPSTSPLTAITNTQLLTSQSNRFLDNSSNAVTPTLTGTPSVQAFQPFPGATTWSGSVLGGSGYFDGSGDYLGLTNSGAFDMNTSFTLELWSYQTASGNYGSLGVGGGAASWSTSNGHEWLVLANYSGTLYFQYNAGGSPGQLTSTGAPINQWNHIAVGFNGTTASVWLNGTRVATGNISITLPTTRNILNIGNLPSLDAPFIGYMSNVRIVRGTDVYGVSNTSITIPTTPLTAITNTSLLTNFTNAGIFDSAMMNDLETVGNAQVSTSVVKYGTGSMAFDGNGDYLQGPNSPLWDFGSGDLTIECWVYPTANAPANDAEIVSYGQPTTLNGWHFGLTGTGTVNRLFFGLNYSGYLLTSTGTVSLNTWTHIAVTRNGNNWRLFINGTQDGSTTSSSTATVNTSCLLYVGTGSYAPGNTARSITGNVDDLRITKGAARYIGNFTPPVARMPQQ